MGVKTPPIGFIPSRPPKARSQESCATVNISFPNKVVKTYRVFFSGTLEQAIKHVYLNKSIVDDLRIAKRISTTKAEIKEKQEQPNLLQSRLGRSRSSMSSAHHRFATGESPESTENFRATKNVSPAQLDELKTEILEFEGNLISLHQSVFDAFKQLLAAWRLSRRCSGRLLRSSATALTTSTSTASASLARPVVASFLRFRQWPLLGSVCAWVRRTRTRSPSAGSRTMFF